MEYRAKDSGRETFISYLNDDDKVISAYVRIIEEKNGMIKFATSSNIITIPVSRVLKIKEKI